MRDVVVDVPNVLAASVDGARELRVEVADGASVGDVLDVLAERFPRFGRKVRNELGEVRRYANVFVGQDNIRDLEGQATVVPAGERIMIVQSVAGG
ncbi:MoaD/ThiS family protein [Zhihengliuella flava]|uniref:Molybdopterin converting factor small subunit n=1 Tax=Zhihengliuella flava TaxID=1285193 RepID=A0A931D953_9MICC|nr:MoaD/ThiS family protein [Zhihengliuella flava]MBG6084654.1 molybdopterin converting factor small subunit [Zhihengliuella flava]